MEKKQTIYKAKYDMVRADYQKIVKDTGEDIEIISFYRGDKCIVSTPPNHNKTIDKLVKILRGTGISKITISLLDKNP